MRTCTLCMTASIVKKCIMHGVHVCFVLCGNDGPPYKGCHRPHKLQNKQPSSLEILWKPFTCDSHGSRPKQRVNLLEQQKHNLLRAVKGAFIGNFLLDKKCNWGFVLTSIIF